MSKKLYARYRAVKKTDPARRKSRLVFIHNENGVVREARLGHFAINIHDSTGLPESLGFRPEAPNPKENKAK